MLHEALYGNWPQEEWQFRPGAGRELRRQWNKQQRQRERQALHRGVQHDY